MSILDVSEFLNDDDFEGEGETFDDACEDAWKKARAASHQSPKWCKVKHHWVKMENPISEHKVIITPSG